MRDLRGRGGHRDRAEIPRRTTLYAAFTPAGIPVLSVWDFDRNRLSVLMSDRAANGTAFAGERIVQITVSAYNRILSARGWPEVTTR